MAILDIRKEQEEEITGIKFDDTGDYIRWTKNTLQYIDDSLEVTFDICDWEDFDNFIAACHKAKELAGK